MLFAACFAIHKPEPRCRKQVANLSMAKARFESPAAWLIGDLRFEKLNLKTPANCCRGATILKFDPFRFTPM